MWTRTRWPARQYIQRVDRSVRACGQRCLSTNRFRVLFCGSDEFSVRNLDKLLLATDVWSSVHVLTPRLRKSPIRKSPFISGVAAAAAAVDHDERHDSLADPTALLDFASNHGLPVSQVPPEGIKHYSFPPGFESAENENVLVTASFGHILPSSFLAHFDHRKRLNVHPSLLPRYRGAAPLQWTIANGNQETGVSVQRLVERGKGIDGGDIVGSVSGIGITSDATYRSLLGDLSEVGGDLLVDVLRKIQAGTDEGEPQVAADVSRAPKIAHDTARVRWSAQTAESIDRLSRGISHQYPLWTTLSGITVQLFNPAVTHIKGDHDHTCQPGTARLERKSGRLVLTCAQGSSIYVERVKSEGKKEMAVGDWWNGLPKGVRNSKEIRFE